MECIVCGFEVGERDGYVELEVTPVGFEGADDYTAATCRYCIEWLNGRLGLPPTELPSPEMAQETSD